MKRRTLTMLLTLVLTLSVITPLDVAANESGPPDNMIKVTDEVVEEIALNWADVQELPVTVSVDNIVRIYDSDDHPVGYSVGYFNNGEPYGYAIIDFDAPGYIAEYNFEENVPDMYSSIISADNISSVSTLSIDEPKMYELYPTAYYVEYEKNNSVEYAGVYGDILNEDEFDFYDSQVKEYEAEGDIQTFSDSDTNPYYSDVDIFINSIPSSYYISETGRFNSFYCCDQYYTSLIAGRFACGVNALAGNARLVESDLYHSDPVSAYNILWNYAATSIYDTIDGVQFGYTFSYNMGPAFLQYLRDEGIEASYNNISDPSYSDFKSTINSKSPNVLCYGINLKDENGDISRSGHCIITEGYTLASSGDNYYYYLFIADGWHNYGRYLNLATSFTDMTLVKFSGVTVSYGY